MGFDFQNLNSVFFDSRPAWNKNFRKKILKSAQTHCKLAPKSTFYQFTKMTKKNITFHKVTRFFVKTTAFKLTKKIKLVVFVKELLCTCINSVLSEKQWRNTYQ